LWSSRIERDVFIRTVLLEELMEWPSAQTGTGL
jgi:hypothetical protein